MLRRRYVVSYDIADDRRRNKVLDLCDGYGDHVQFSVFLADLTERELVELRMRLRDIINEREDQVLIVDLGTFANGEVQIRSPLLQRSGHIEAHRMAMGFAPRRQPISASSEKRPH